MPAEPSIKGTIFRGVVEDVRRLLEAGRLRAEELEAELPARDRALLEDKILDATWYPMETYARLTDLLCRREGAGRVRYYQERGERSAQRLIEGGLYSQLQFLGRWQEDERRGSAPTAEAMLASYASKLRRVVSMAGSIYSVGRWSVVADPEDAQRLAVEIEEARAYSEGMRYAIEGFLNACARSVRPELRRLFVTERPEPERIRVRMTRSVPELYATAGDSPG